MGAGFLATKSHQKTQKSESGSVERELRFMSGSGIPYIPWVKLFGLDF
jgi:hypothetical protein